MSEEKKVWRASTDRAPEGGPRGEGAARSEKRVYTSGAPAPPSAEADAPPRARQPYRAAAPQGEEPPQSAQPPRSWEVPQGERPSFDGEILQGDEMPQSEQPPPGAELLPDREPPRRTEPQWEAPVVESLPREQLLPERPLLERTPRVGPFLAWFIPAVAVFVLGFAAAARWDLLIDERVYDPGSIFAIAFECFGWYPAFLPIILFMGLWAAARGASAWKRVLGGFLALVGMLVLYYAAWHYMEKRGWANGAGDYRTWTWLAVGVLVLILLAFWLFNLRLDTRNRLFFFGLAGSAYMIANQVVIYAVKLVWQRPRFDDMLAGGSFSDFMAWYEPLGPGGSSFPSAHTANAAGIFCLLILCDIFPRLARHRKLCTLICWVYIAAMAAARIQMGRHFLSDTLAAAGIMALLFFWMRRTKIYKRGCEAARAGTLRIFKG